MKRPSVFLSYSSKDIILASQIAEDLKRQGFNVWFDKLEILVGDSISERIQIGLDSADFVAVLLTQHSVASGWVAKEWQSKVGIEAETRNICILPLKGDECVIPTLLRDKRLADLSENYDKGFSTLISSLKAHISRVSSSAFYSKPTAFDSEYNSPSPHKKSNENSDYFLILEYDFKKCRKCGKTKFTYHGHKWFRANFGELYSCDYCGSLHHLMGDMG